MLITGLGHGEADINPKFGTITVLSGCITENVCVTGQVKIQLKLVVSTVME
jgi:hypothetical protein